MTFIFLPRMMHLPLAFATALNAVGVVSLELFLAILYSVYNYSCGCYMLASKQPPQVSV